MWISTFSRTDFGVATCNYIYSLLRTSVNKTLFFILFALFRVTVCLSLSLFDFPLILDGIVVMGEIFRSFAMKRIRRLVCTPGVFIRRANSTSAWTVTRRLKESQYMATHRNAVAAQNFDYFLVLDFEATCDNQRTLIPQVKRAMVKSGNCAGCGSATG